MNRSRFVSVGGIVCVIIGYIVLGGVLGAVLPGFHERTRGVFLPIALLVYVFIIAPRQEKRVQDASRLSNAEGFIRGFLMSAPVPGSSSSAIHIARMEAERLKSVKTPPGIGSDPYYYAETPAEFGLLSIEEYARRDDIDELLRYCQKFHNEARSSW